jgi:hypothetical protein
VPGSSAAVDLERLSAYVDRFIISFGKNQLVPENPVRAQIERVELLGSAGFGDGLGSPACVCEQIAVPQMRGRKIRIQLDGSAERPFGILPVPVVIEQELSKRSVSFGQ